MQTDNIPIVLRGLCLSALALACVMLFFLAGPVHAQVASPMQPGHYVPGVISLRDYAAPTPGLFVFVYNWYVWSDIYIDRHGNELTNIGPNSGLDVDMNMNAFATVPMITWVSPFTILGGAWYFAGISPNYTTADYKIAADLERGGDLTPGKTEEGNISGWSDLVVSPLGLSWSFGKFDNVTMSDEELAEIGMPPFRRFNVTVVYSFAAPTGRYETGASNNIGLGFWTHQLQGFGYFYPFEHQATAIMAGLTYELNSEIKDVEVTPGNRLSLEWGISQYLTDWFELQVGGAHNWQISDDTGSDVYWDPSYYDRKNMIHFGAGFWPVSQRFYVLAKYGFEFGISQRFKNNNLLLNLIYVTNLLTGR